jgi:hypothetical protein
MIISLGMNLQPGAFGGGNQFGKALSAYLQKQGIQVVYDLAHPEIDLILLADPRPDLKITAYNHQDILYYLRHINPRALVVHRVNECDERKGAYNEINPLLRQANRIADHTVFVSEWLSALHRAQGMPAFRHSVILNGADRAIFHAQGYQPWHLGEKLKLVTHHWGTNWQKGFDIYLKLDAMMGDPAWRDKLSFTYIGRLPDGLQWQHAQQIDPLSGDDLANALRQHHVYITASQCEPGSNHQNEGALCGLPLLYLDSASMPEYCDGFGIMFQPETFEQKMTEMLARYDELVPQMAAFPHTSERTCAAYHTLFNELIQNREALLAERRWPTSLPSIHSQDTAIQWLRSLREPLLNFVGSLQSDTPGRYHPAAEGLTNVGQDVSLPYSTWALKIHRLLDSSPDDLPVWLAYIQSFQVTGNPLHLRTGANAFIDQALTDRVRIQTRRLQRWRDQLLPPPQMTRLEAVVSAETKQAIATLAEFGMQTQIPYQGFPSTESRLNRYLNSLDWSQPWAAGAHVATLAVFYRTEAPRFLPPARVQSLLTLCNDFLRNLIDSESGAYFQGHRPNYGELVNGAMKVLTALDWLETPVHAPEKLIDTVLSAIPASEGCHLVDAVYVLYRCWQVTDYRRRDIQAYMVNLLPTMQAHFNPLDGGFSYYMPPQPHTLHGMRMIQGRPVSDLHGTLLLTWAASLILHMLDAAEGWSLIKP